MQCAPSCAPAGVARHLHRPRGDRAVRARPGARCPGRRGSLRPSCPPRCRGRAPPWGLGADEHVGRAAEVERHHKATAGIEADEHVRRAAEVERHHGVSAALPRSRATAGRGADVRAAEVARHRVRPLHLDRRRQAGRRPHHRPRDPRRRRDCVPGELHLLRRPRGHRGHRGRRPGDGPSCAPPPSRRPFLPPQACAQSHRAVFYSPFPPRTALTIER